MDENSIPLRVSKMKLSNNFRDQEQSGQTKQIQILQD